MPFARRIPLPIAALALGLAGLGNLLATYSPVLRAACGLAAAAVVLLVVTKITLDFAGVREELANPAALSVFPAFFMALMLLATYLKPLSAAAATALWIVALALQLLLTASFIVRHAGSSKLAQVLPGWFLVFVGFVVGSVTSPAFGMASVGRFLLYAGLAGYVATLPVIAYRVARLGPLPGPALPTLAIFAAPPSLCLVGYLAVAESKHPAVVYLLLGAAVLSVLFVISRLPRILGLGFLPSFGALTFPFVISATALKQAHLFLGSTDAGSPFPGITVATADAFAAAMVLYVLVRYIAFLVASPVSPPSTAAASESAALAASDTA